MRVRLLGWLGSAITLGVLTGAGAAAAAESKVLLDNERHVVTVEYDGPDVVFVLEALRDTTDDLSGSFPKIDFASVAFDVDHNGRVDKATDVKYGAWVGSRDRVCAQFFESDSSYSKCGSHASGASVVATFEATEHAPEPHPVWTYRIPARELSKRGKMAHVAFKFHEAGRGYTQYPNGGKRNMPFSQVLQVPLVPPSRARDALDMKDYKRLKGGRSRLVELLRNDQHVVSAQRGRSNTTIVVEAVGDATDNLTGTYPDLDFVSIKVDVDQNLAVSPQVDVAYGVQSGSASEICAQQYLSASSWTGCGGFESDATLKTEFRATEASASPHPVWTFSLPNRELSSNSMAHLVFLVHAAGGGYTVYPEPLDDNQVFSRVAGLNLRTLEGGVRPEEVAAGDVAVPAAVINHDVTPPTIELSLPGPADAQLTMDSKTVRVAGHAEDENGLYDVLVHGNEANVSATGDFWADVPLAIGENQIRIRAQDTHENWAEVGVTVTRESVAAPSQVTEDDASRGLDVPEETEEEPLITGAYHALLIGVQDYSDEVLTDLDHPVADARRLQDVLIANYAFEPANVTVVENPTEDGIIAELDALASRAGPDDNVLIFYAGHGTWNDIEEEGFWLPADAAWDRSSRYISNGTVSSKIRAMGAQHTLLISDACFSGSLFKTRSAFTGADRAVQELHRLPSRKAMTSGTMSEVPDDSVFLDYLIDRLESSTAHWLTADALFADFRQAVINNSPNTPQYGVIFEAGDEGGEFVFIRK